MPNESQQDPRPLPDRPNLRHLKDEAKARLRAGDAVPGRTNLWICELAETQDSCGFGGSFASRDCGTKVGHRRKQS